MNSEVGQVSDVPLYREGQTLGPYRIVSFIAAGGMGQVYRARDPRMGRDVAIKVAAERFSERFSREVHAVAALNHPNICHLYDVGPNYLVMELIEGESPKGPLPLEEALRIARQIADALEAAHEKGIVHRDLKPGNIKVRPDGSVKVLDFGLAKSAEQAELTSDSPTMLSAAGMILGTAAYMSPEQARGKVVDKRADIWAFGVVLYEMLTGKRPFEGETTTEILSEVIKTEPSWTGIPPRAQRLLKSCLKKDPKKRLRDIGDAWQLLEDGPESAPPSRSRLAWGVTALLALIAGVALWAPWRVSPPPAAKVQRFELTPPEIGGPDQGPAISVSPDGTRLVFSYRRMSAGSGGGNGLWVRRLDSVEFRLLDGTRGSDGDPFWSPDSRFIAFGTSDGKLKKIESTGGPAQTLADAARVYGGFWTADGRIVFSAAKKAGPSNDLFQLPAAGGVATPLQNVDRPRADEGLYTPVLLPDRRHFVYVLYGGPSNQHNGIYLGSLDARPTQNARRLMLDVSDVVYASSPDPDLGYVLFVRGTLGINQLGTLMAQPFDLRRLNLAGEPIPVAERVADDGGFAASRTGVLTYLAGAGATFNNDVQLTLFDRWGEVFGKVGEPSFYGSSYVAFSPDGTRVAASRADRQSGHFDVWITDLARGVSSRFTYGPRGGSYPVWSPDGNQIAFASIQNNGANDIYLKLSNGGGDEELLLKAADPDRLLSPASWSRDGRFLLLSGNVSMRAGWLLPLESQRHAAGKPFVFQRGGMGNRFSPDMRWVSYSSNESGAFEIYVQPFDPNSPTGSPPGGGKWLVSKGGGVSPRWNGNGKELFYAAPDGTIMSVDVSANPAFDPGIPKPLFKTKAQRLSDRMIWDVSPDGKKFLLPIPVAANTAAPPFTVVLNWQAGLKK